MKHIVLTICALLLGGLLFAQNVEKLQKLDILKKKVKKFVFARNAEQN